MNKFLNSLERKWGKYAIPDLIRYFIGFYCIGAVIGLFLPELYYQYLSLDFGMIMKGQIWRLVTFVLEPQIGGVGMSSMISILFFILKVYIFLMFGRSLEQAWGTFRFNLYFFSGILLNIIAAAVLYAATGIPYYTGVEYIYQGMFFAFALLYPNMEFLLYFIIPIKVKWLAIVDAVLLLHDVFTYIRYGFYSVALAIIIAFVNFLIFFITSRNYKKVSPKEIRRRKKFKKEVREARKGTRHKCAICGRTEEDNPDLEFRYCSKCNGNYEYCSDHLFSHVHVK